LSLLCVLGRPPRRLAPLAISDYPTKTPISITSSFLPVL
jgi:hypothetical protein